MRSVDGRVRVAALYFGSVAAGIVGASCWVGPPPTAHHDTWTHVSETSIPVYGGRCPRCNEWVKGSPAGWAHGADEAGRPWNWHGYLAKCAKCGANVCAELDDVEVKGRFTIIHWRRGEDDQNIATAPVAGASS